MKAMLTGKQLSTYSVPHRRKLIGEWMKQGDFGIVFAWRGVGKTWFALLMADSLINGKPLGPWQAYGKDNKLLYIDGEMPADDIKIRAKLLKLLDNERFVLLNHEILFQQCQKDLNLANVDQQNMITNICVKQKYKILILDNLSSLFTNLKEDKADDWDSFVKPWLLNLRRRAITVILLCHSGKDMKLRGTSKKEDIVFWSIDLAENRELPPEEGKKQCRFVNRFTKTRNSPETAFEEYLWTLTTTTGPKEESTRVDHMIYGMPQRVLTMIQGGYTKCQDIAKELDLTPGRVSQIVNRELREKVTIVGRDYLPKTI